MSETYDVVVDVDLSEDLVGVIGNPKPREKPLGSSIDCVPVMMEAAEKITLTSLNVGRRRGMIDGDEVVKGNLDCRELIVLGDSLSHICKFMAFASFNRNVALQSSTRCSRENHFSRDLEMKSTSPHTTRTPCI